jgi:CubicO group peptidase (beta-lactamase class C family)
MNSELLAKGIEFLWDEKVNIHSLLVVRNGYLVLDAYFYPFEKGYVHDLASVTKSFTSTLIGLAIGKGHIKDPGQPVLGFFPDRTIANVDENKKAMALEDLLTMRTGLQCYSEPNEPTLFEMMSSPDWTQFMLDLPMLERPGTRFEYCSGGSHLLSAIVHETTGMNELAFARENLFGPLGITSALWPLDPQGVNNHGWGDLRLTPHDMARLGFLYLQQGKWDGKQILPKEYIAAATRRNVSLSDEPFDGYGYQWWISSSGFYSAVGRGGQYIVVLPRLQMAVVVTSGIGDSDERGKLYDLLNDYIIAAVESENSLPANPEGIAFLESTVQKATRAIEDEHSPSPPLPSISGEVSGNTYALEPNPYGLLTLSMTFKEKDDAMLRLSMNPAITGAERLEVPIGMDNTYRVSRGGRFGMSVALKGKWENDNTFVVKYDEIGNINNWRISIAFQDDTITVHMQEATNLAEANFGGKVQE